MACAFTFAQLQRFTHAERHAEGWEFFNFWYINWLGFLPLFVVSSNEAPEGYCLMQRISFVSKNNLHILASSLMFASLLTCKLCSWKWRKIRKPVRQIGSFEAVVWMNVWHFRSTEFFETGTTEQMYQAVLWAIRHSEDTAPIQCSDFLMKLKSRNSHKWNRLCCWGLSLLPGLFYSDKKRVIDVRGVWKGDISHYTKWRTLISNSFW